MAQPPADSVEVLKHYPPNAEPAPYLCSMPFYPSIKICAMCDHDGLNVPCRLLARHCLVSGHRLPIEGNMLEKFVWLIPSHLLPMVFVGIECGDFVPVKHAGNTEVHK